MLLASVCIRRSQINVPDVVILTSPSPAAGGGSLSQLFHSSLLVPPSKRIALPWTWIILAQFDRVSVSAFP